MELAQLPTSYFDFRAFSLRTATTEFVPNSSVPRVCPGRIRSRSCSTEKRSQPLIRQRCIIRPFLYKGSPQIKSSTIPDYTTVVYKPRGFSSDLLTSSPRQTYLDHRLRFIYQLVPPLHFPKFWPCRCQSGILRMRSQRALSCFRSIQCSFLRHATGWLQRPGERKEKTKRVLGGSEYTTAQAIRLRTANAKGSPRTQE